MPATQVRATQIKDSSISRDDLNVATAGQAVVTKIIAGTGVTLTWTGADAGSGDVTLNG